MITVIPEGERPSRMIDQLWLRAKAQKGSGGGSLVLNRTRNRCPRAVQLHARLKRKVASLPGFAWPVVR